MTRVFIWKNNSPQEWEEISFSAFSKARRNGCFTGRFFVETVKMFRDEDDRIIMECSRKDFEKYQQEDRHSRYLQEHEKSRSIFPASHVGDRDGTEEGYQDTDLFVDESVDTAEQAICNLLMADLHRALQQLSQKERSFILDYYGMEKPSNLVFCSSNGRPMESQVINRAFNKLIKENGLPHVVFHSLRHSSITYKLKLNGGDMKSVQGDSGHAQVKMVADVYSHIIDEDRCINAQRLEEAFYSSKTPDPVEDTEPKTADTAVTESDESDAAKILELLKNPETAALLKQLAKAL